jgi:5-methyltetrahydrofolate--homocysteine methyltransferase
MPDGSLEFPPPIEPPFYGTGPLITWEPELLLDAVDRTRLVKAIRGGAFAAVAETVEENIDSVLNKIIAEMESEKLLEPAGLYGYFPVITDDELVIILDPSDYATEKAELRFPRLQNRGGRSIADYLRPEGDLLAVQMATIGPGIDERIAGRNNVRGSNNGISGILAEYVLKDLAGRVALEITRGLGLPAGTGRRIGFGLPGMPGLVEQQTIYELLAIEERLGVMLSESFQPVPRQSLLELNFHHLGPENF